MNARLRREDGFTLVEALVSVAILTLALVTFLTGLSTGVLSTNHTDRLSTAQELARSQIEDTKEQPFQALPASYPTVTPPGGYAVTVSAASLPDGDAAIQLLTVQVSKDGAVVFTLEGYKVDR
jgi:type II secretory pathway pseudopilin PulG